MKYLLHKVIKSLKARNANFDYNGGENNDSIKASVIEDLTLNADLGEGKNKLTLKARNDLNLDYQGGETQDFISLKSNEIHALNINLGDGFNKFSASAKDELSLDLNSGIGNDSVNLKSLYSEVTINDTGGNDKYSINSRDNSQLDITLEGGQNILNIKALQFKKLTELQNDFGFDVVIDEDLGLGIIDPELSEEDLIMNLSVNSSEENGSNKVNMNIKGDIDVLDLYSGQGKNTFKIKGDLIGDDQNDPDDNRSADFNISGSTNLKN